MNRRSTSASRRSAALAVVAIARTSCGCLPGDLPPDRFVRSRHVRFDQPSVVGRAIIITAVIAAATAAAVILLPRQGHGAEVRAGAEAGEEHEGTRTIHGATCGIERW